MNDYVLKLQKNGKAFLTHQGWGVIFGSYTVWENGKISKQVDGKLVSVELEKGSDGELYFNCDGYPVFNFDDYQYAKYYTIEDVKKISRKLNYARFVCSLYFDAEYHEIIVKYIDGNYENCSPHNLKCIEKRKLK